MFDSAVGSVPGSAEAYLGHDEAHLMPSWGSAFPAAEFRENHSREKSRHSPSPSGGYISPHSVGRRRMKAWTDESISKNHPVFIQLIEILLETASRIANLSLLSFPRRRQT